MIKTVIAIPARLESKRLPNKLIMKVGKKTIIERVLVSCIQSKSPSEVYLCTDNELIKKIGHDYGVNVLMTSKACNSGTERIASVLKKIISLVWEESFEEMDIKKKEQVLTNTVIINIQADQPFLESDLISKISDNLVEDSHIKQIVTPIYKLSGDNIHNPNVVKTLLNKRRKAIYFSRSALPHVRDINPDEWHLYHDYWGHYGIYAYRADVLNIFRNLDMSKLEEVEKLEQLKFIDAGYEISTFEVETQSLSVDTLEQLKEARKIASRFDNI
tara:strand:+ start:13389 stop:14207 length:819 start_codon:yes stop_codon:yes gene_type:complete